MNKILLLLLIFLIIPFVSSETNIFLQNSEIQISHPIRVEGAIASNINATITVKNPSNIIVASGPMYYFSSISEHAFNLTSGNTSSLGNYNYCISATNGSLSNTECFNYEVTITGVKPTTSQGVLFFFIGLLSIVLFLLSLYGAIKIKWKHQRDNSGNIVGINDLKYIKLLLWFVTYLLLIFITYSFRYVSYVGNLDVAGNFMNAIFWFLIVFLLPVFIITFLIGIISYLDAKKIDKLIRRNLKVR